MVLKRYAPQVLNNFVVKPQFQNFKTEIHIVQTSQSLVKTLFFFL